LTSLFLVNHISEVKAEQSTAGLIVESAKRDETWLAEADGLEANQGRSTVRAVRVDGKTTTAELQRLHSNVRMEVRTLNNIHVRLNPARDPRRWLSTWILDLLDQAAESGVNVINHPAGLRRFGTKTGLRHLPTAWVPETLLTTDPEAAQTFVRSRPRTVLKPASGTQGRGVFILGCDDPNVSAVIEMLTTEGPLVAQEWLEEAVDGDQRIIVLDGEVLQVRGHPAVVRRRPQGRELRSNVHLGAVPEVGEVGDREQALVAACGPILAQSGVRLAGLDCIGGKVIEANVWSPGGLTDMAVLQGLPATSFYSAVLDAFG
jgi:glutathione synthase